MAEVELRCNFQTCRKVLDQTAFVTSCSHIFCSHHGQASASNEKCLACGTKFKNKGDFSVMNLQPTDQNKSMMLSGLNPDQVLEIASRSISFYTYQLYNENRLKDELLKENKEEVENLKSYCTSLKAKYKVDIEKLQRTTIGLKKEIEEKVSELEKQREQICQYSRLSKKLQLELAACKRNIVTLKTGKALCGSNDCQNITPRRFEFNLESEKNSRGKESNFLFDQASSDMFSSNWPHARYSN